MIRHYLVAALRNMAANPLLSAISILGLAVGLAAAILMALVVRNQLTYDDFIPGYERTYMGATEGADPSAPPWMMDRTHRQFAALLTLNIPQIESAARLMVTDSITGGDVVFSHGNFTGAEKIYWADPNMFDVLPLPALYGDPKTALRQPDGIVLPRAIARKYFGRDDAVGQILQLNGRPMMVRAVIEDLPANGTELESGIFASNLAPFLGFANYKPSPPGQFTPADIGVRTYFRLRPGASVADVARKAALLIKPIYQGNFNMPLIRLDRVHLVENLNADVLGGLNTGVTARIAVAALVGVLVLFIAAVNFVNLMLARAARREREVGVRKASGAGRADLMLQFLGEAIVATLLAAVAAMALSEWLLPVVNGFLQTGARSSVDPLMAVAFLLGIVTVGVAAGAYPALVLSSFRPASVLKGAAGVATGPLRNGLVVMQFAILIVLAIASAVVWQQRNYATQAALRVNTDQILVVRIPGRGVTCPQAFKTEVGQLAGVRSVACTGAEFLDLPMTWRYPTKNGYSRSFDLTHTDWSAFATYGIKPIAGTLVGPGAARGDVINRAAVKVLGFASAEAAIGKTLPYAQGTDGKVVSPIIAVVPDFALDPVARAVKPALFVNIDDPGVLGSLLHLKLDGRRIPETLAAIDKAWRATGQTLPIDRFFMNQHMQERYLAMLREAQMFALCAGIAILLACLGLVGISTSTAERRTKEIGVRKAMGARDGEIVILLLWQFARPVLWANVIAWPLAWWAMNRWLNGFADHVALHWWLFPAAGLATLMIALLTVAGQAWLVARQKPVLALRYE